MKKQFLFDLELLRIKKWFSAFSLGIHLLYFLAAMWLYMKNSYILSTITIVFSTLHTYSVLGAVTYHSKSNHLANSNFALCIYFPTKRKYFLYSKSLLTLIVLSIQLALATLAILLSSSLQHTSIDYEILSSVLLSAFIAAITCSGIILVTCTLARAFQIGAILSYTLMAMACGFFTAMGEDEAGEGAYLAKGVVVLIFLLIWGIANGVAQLIARKVSV